MSKGTDKTVREIALESFVVELVKYALNPTQKLEVLGNVAMALERSKLELQKTHKNHVTMGFELECYFLYLKEKIDGTTK